ncbi:MAG: hypothetical protein IJT07_04060 [Oscillospiraceae bacterium]|nr:hypothetical protein [Oscillospiraceae bacterium]
MKEIGGYIEFETYHRPMLHEGALALNCGRNALAYLIEARSIRRIALPAFLCASVIDICRRYDVTIRTYDVGSDFLPEPLTLQPDEWLYLVNFYGQISDQKLQDLAKAYPRVILDQAQAYFATPVAGVDTIYTCRKFFGVPDGAFLYTDSKLDRALPRDESRARMDYLLGRFERTGSEFYAQYTANNTSFTTAPMMQMSRLTENLLRGIDYDEVRRRRRENFAALHAAFGDANALDVHMVDGAFMYPLMTPNAEAIRTACQKEKLYIPLLWPNVVKDVQSDWTAWHLAHDVLPLPCDQRYSAEDMQRVIDLLRRFGV